MVFDTVVILGIIALLVVVSVEFMAAVAKEGLSVITVACWVTLAKFVPIVVIACETALVVFTVVSPSLLVLVMLTIVFNFVAVVTATVLLATIAVVVRAVLIDEGATVELCSETYMYSDRNAENDTC